jgi:hypothetical protein
VYGGGRGLFRDHDSVDSEYEQTYGNCTTSVTDLFPNASETTGFPTFVHWLHNPVNSRILSDLGLRCVCQEWRAYE